ncbi:MAG: ribonuclease III [Lachnospiraceae bacterium]|nr:ribonuclease III [Lachnospiraceae bacterium]
MNEVYGILEEKIEYSFKDRSHLRCALTHSSYANEIQLGRAEDYERYEFLGDAVLEMVSSDFLFRKFPEKNEGELTKIRASLVCEPTLAQCARELELNRYIRLGRGEERQGSANKDSIISDVFEAVIGAIYMDGGIECAREFIERKLLQDMDNLTLFYDTKTRLQTLVQKYKGELEYNVIGESGPDHNKMFEVEVLINKERISTGIGSSKKAAQQKAAYNALMKLKEEK